MMCFLFLPLAVHSQYDSHLDSTYNTPLMAAPSSVRGRIIRDARLYKKYFKPYFDFKLQLLERTGFVYGLDYNSGIQTTSPSPGKTASGGIFRAYLNWTLVGLKSGITGEFIFGVEQRHSYGHSLSMLDLGAEIGYIGSTVDAVGNLGWALTNVQWEQYLFNKRLGFTIGLVDVSDYVNVYGLVDPTNDFMNPAFSNGMTLPLPDQGLGFAIMGFITEQWYVLGGMADANGNPTDIGNVFNSFFNAAEFFSHFELGWIRSFEKMYTDNIHITAWYSAERRFAQLPEGWGLAFSYSRRLNDHWLPFFRAGYGNAGGTLWQRSIEAGTSYKFPKNDHQLSLGISWGQPSELLSEEHLTNQVTLEAYYRFYVLKVLTITPDVQLLIHPSLNPDRNVVAVFGLRGRIGL